MADMWVVLLVVVGAVLFCAGLGGGYVSYLNSAAQAFFVWMVVAFIGIILTLSGFALGMKGRPEEKEEE